MGNTLIAGKEPGTVFKSSVVRTEADNAPQIELAFAEDAKDKVVLQKEEKKDSDPKGDLNKLLTDASEGKISPDILKKIDELFPAISNQIINRLAQEEGKKANPSKLGILKSYTKEEIEAIDVILKDLEKVIKKLDGNNQEEAIELNTSLKLRYHRYQGLKASFSMAKDFKDVKDGKGKVEEKILTVFPKRNRLRRLVEETTGKLATAEGKEKKDLEEELLKSKLDLSNSLGELEGLKSVGIFVDIQVLEMRLPPPQPKPKAPNTCE
jgi:hypothetical protein